MGISGDCQKTMDVFYKGDKVGHYIADMVIEDKIVVELKAVVDLRPEHEWQLINYLAASNMNLGLLINFGQSVKVKRKILTKDGKTDE